jgi:hypothetical protein
MSLVVLYRSETPGMDMSDMGFSQKDRNRSYSLFGCEEMAIRLRSLRLLLMKKSNPKSSHQRAVPLLVLYADGPAAVLLGAPP